LSFWIIFHKVSVDVVLKIILSLDHHLHVIQNFIIRVFLLPIFLNDLLILFWLTLLWLSRLLKVRLYLTFLNIVVVLHHTCELDDFTPYLQVIGVFLHLALGKSSLMVHLSLLGEFTFFFRKKDISVFFDDIFLQIFFLPRLHRLTGVNLADFVHFHYDFRLLG
jgi:hypothetical protein